MREERDIKRIERISRIKHPRIRELRKEREPRRKLRTSELWGSFCACEDQKERNERAIVFFRERRTGTQGSQKLRIVRAQIESIVRTLGLIN